MKSVNPISPCASFDDDLKAYLDNELPLLRRLQVRSHVMRCSQCQEELKLMQTIEQEVKEEAMAPLESDLRAKILQNVPDDARVSSPPVNAPSSLTKPKKSFSWAPMEYATVFGILFILGIGVMSITGNRIKNTFNTAANSLADGGPGDYSSGYSAPAAGAAAPASADNFAQKARVDRVTSNFDPTASLANPAPTERSVHKEGSLTVSVDNSETAGSSVEALVKNSGGFVASNALSTGVGGVRSATLDVRIPVASFESIVKKIGALGTVRAKSISGEDITAKVAVSGARKETLSNQLSMAEARMRELNKEFKADSPEIYRARAEIRNLSLQAAAARAELETLRRFAALSTLYVTLQDKEKAATPASFSGSLNQTGNDAWASFLNTARLPIQLIIWILAYSPLWLPALIIWRKFGKKLVF